MYNIFRKLSETWLRIPPEPEAPPGDEATARVFRAAPKYLRYLRVLWGIRNGILLLAASIPLLITTSVMALDRQGGAATVVGILGLMVLAFLVVKALFSLAMVQLDFEKRWYIVTNRSLRIREGVMTVREITFTFANIQNLSVTQGPVQRLLGIADLKVETAGGGSVAGQHQHPGLNLHTAYFRGIDNAEEVKQLVADRMRGLRDSGLGDHDDPKPPMVSPSRQGDGADALRAVLAEAILLRKTVEQRP
jgi:membrane protein YdbS with pleckstrin-like domain